MILTPLLQTGVTIDLEQQAQAQQLAGSQFDGFGGFLSQMLNLILVVAGLLLLLYLIWGAVNWMSSGGDSSKVQKARDQITQAVIGLIVLLSSLAIFNLIQGFFGFQVLNFGKGSSSGVNRIDSLPASGSNSLNNSTGQRLLDARRLLEDSQTGPGTDVVNDTVINQQ